MRLPLLMVLIVAVAALVAATEPTFRPYPMSYYINCPIMIGLEPEGSR